MVDFSTLPDETMIYIENVGGALNKKEFIESPFFLQALTGEKNIYIAKKEEEYSDTATKMQSFICKLFFGRGINFIWINHKAETMMEEPCLQELCGKIDKLLEEMPIYSAGELIKMDIKLVVNKVEDDKITFNIEK